MSPINDTGLVGYWTFDEGTGTQAKDYSGNNNTGTLSSPAPAWVIGKVGGALSFNGISNKVSLSSTNLNIITTQASVSAWIMLSSNSSNNYIYTNGWGDKLELFINGTRVAFTIVNSLSSSVSTSGAIPLQTGIWYFVAGVYDGNMERVYVNGTQDGSGATQTGNIRSYTANYWIGAGQNGGGVSLRSY